MNLPHFSINHRLDAILDHYTGDPSRDRQELMVGLLIQFCGQADLLRAAASKQDGEAVNEHLLRSVMIGLAALRSAGANLEAMITEASVLMTK